MTSITVWLLIIAGQGGGTSGAHIAKFVNQEQCLMVAEDIRQQTSVKKGMAYLFGICVKATILKE